MRPKSRGMDKVWLMLLSVSMFSGGVYVLLTRRHVLLLLLGGELLLHAAALNFIVFGAAGAEAQLLLLCLLAVAVSEAVLLLALAWARYKACGSMYIDLFDKEDEVAHE